MTKNKKPRGWGRTLKIVHTHAGSFHKGAVSTCLPCWLRANEGAIAKARLKGEALKPPAEARGPRVIAWQSGAPLRSLGRYGWPNG